MKQIIGAFSAMLVFLISIFGFIGITNVSAQVAAAKEFKADCIAEIENSNFNPHVIASCQTQAATGGYGLSVTNTTYDADGNVNTAEVIVTYSYTIPLFGISQTQTTRGIAR